jgi:vancomycin resistance protein YoaR
LRLAASKLDGRDHAGRDVRLQRRGRAARRGDGYKVAPVIAQGELVDGIGGGRQVVGDAARRGVLSGLDIVERKPYTRPSFYIKMGLDATVVPDHHARLRNSFAHPVVLHETVRDGVVRGEVLGPEAHAHGDVRGSTT